VMAIAPANGDNSDAKKDEASTVTFTGLSDAMELSQQLIEALPGVVETEMDTESGIATVTTDGASFCPHTALTLLRAHGIDAEIDGQEKSAPKKPSGGGCPYEKQRMMNDVRHI